MYRIKNLYNKDFKPKFDFYALFDIHWMMTFEEISCIITRQISFVAAAVKIFSLVFASSLSLSSMKSPNDSAKFPS